MPTKTEQANETKPCTRAWIVNSGDVWCTLMHADTEGKAKAAAMGYVDDFSDFVDYRARRFPELDGKPFTYQNCKDAGFEYFDESGVSLPEKWFVNDCRCKICKG